MADAERARTLLLAAKARLDGLDWYPHPVRLRGVRLVSLPWLFRIPGMRRFDGYATWRVIAVRDPLEVVGQDLVTHELCHVWQMQHAPLRMPLSYAARGYADNPFERQARAAAALTAPEPPARAA